MDSARKPMLACWAVVALVAGSARGQNAWTQSPPTETPYVTPMPAGQPPMNSGYAGTESQWEQQRVYNPPTNVDAVGPCCGICGGGCGTPPLWDALEEVRIMARSRARRVPLFSDVTSTGARHTVFSGKSLQFDVAPGYYTLVERYLGRDAQNYDWFLQAGYWGTSNWLTENSYHSIFSVAENTSLGQVTHGAIQSAFAGALPGLDGVSDVAGRYNSSLNTAEINLVMRPRGRPDRLVLHPNGKWQRECQTGVYWNWLVGFRYMNLEERLELDARGTAQPAGAAAPTPIAGDFLVGTSNNLYGFQVGTELQFRNCVFEWGTQFKVSPMINDAEQRAQILTSNPLFGNQNLMFESGSSRQVSALIDWGLTGTYHVRPNFSLNAGYDIMWLTGVALAPEQYLSIGKPNTHGTIFMQGLSVGFEWSR